MAKQYGSYLGGFSGTLGPAVGYMWNGVWCMRSRPQHVHNPRTAKQIEHRNMFKAEVQLAARLRWAVINGLRETAREAHMTPFNLFVSLNQHCFSLKDGALEVDYSRLSLSTGPVAPVEAAGVTVDEGNVLNISFEKNPLRLSCSQYDSVYLYVYAPSSGEGFLAAPVYRRSKQLSVSLPDSFAGQEVHLYLMVKNERGEWSETTYGGCLAMEPTQGVDDAAAIGLSALEHKGSSESESNINESPAKNSEATPPDEGYRRGPNANSATT